MKRILSILILFFCSLNSTKASHIYGGDIGYKSLGGNTYELYLILYGDCSGQSFPNLFNSSPVIEIYNSGSFYQKVSLAITGNAGLEVTPICPSQANNTTCQNGSEPGVAQFIFKKQITLNAQSTNWRFIFNGSMGTGLGYAGRSASISNISANGQNTSRMLLEATLNNNLANNNSANYSTIPTPFFCINTQQEYNQGAIDADGDLLSFDLVEGLDGSSASGYVNYVSPFTYYAPMGTSNFSFNNTNGQLSFLPNIVQQALVVSKVTETRNGVVVGTSMREMTFIIRSNCNNQPPSGFIYSSNFGTIPTQNTIEFCNSGNSVANIEIHSSDPNSDNITATINGLPANSTYTITGNGTPTPVVNINYTVPIPFVNGNNIFYITFQDDACPISSKQTIAYNIKLVQPISSNPITSNESCYPQNDGSIIVNGVTTNNSLQYSLNNNTFQTTDTFKNLSAGTYYLTLKDDQNCIFKDTAIILESKKPEFGIPFVSNIRCNGEQNGIISVSATQTTPNLIYSISPLGIVNSTGYFDNLPQNNYVVIVKDNKSCMDTINLTIAEPPVILLTSVNTKDLTCNKINGEIIATSNFTDSVYYFLEPGIGSDDDGVFTDLTAGTYTISVINKNGCKTQQTVTLNTIPKTLSASTTQYDLQCNGDGTEGYAEVFPNAGTPPYTYLWTTTPIQTNAKATDLYYGWYFVTVTDATGCDVKDTIYIKPGNCCENIFAAEVFTPNGDGHNDDWGLVTSTGMEVKQFFIVNRWGQKVWETDNQRSRWDGRQKTRIVENGTYYYLLKYKCLTDNKIYFKKGEVNVMN